MVSMMRTMMAKNHREEGAVANSKLLKFETMVNDIRKYLNPRETNGLFAAFADFSTDGDKIFSPKCIIKHIQNPYIKILDDALLHPHGIMGGFMKMGMGTNVSYIAEKDLIESYKRNNIIYRKQCYVVIFWMPFTTAIDDEIYNNELSGIIDLAYCLDFNEEMIRDWCRAIEYVLSGNRLNENCDLECESEEGNRFFLHK